MSIINQKKIYWIKNKKIFQKELVKKVKISRKVLTVKLMLLNKATTKVIGTNKMLL